MPTEINAKQASWWTGKTDAIGDGIVDDTKAIQDVIRIGSIFARTGLVNTILQPGATVVIPAGVYNLASLSAPLDIMSNLDASRATFIVPNSYDGIVMRIGNTTSGSYFQNAIINLPDIIKSNSASIVAGSVGVKTLNIGNSQINFARVAFFETGIWFSGLGQGTAYNQINLGWISYCKVSVKLVPEAAGWVNQNTFIGGGIQQSPGSFGGGLRRSGWRHLVIDGAGINPVNGNTFIGTSFEGDVSEYTFYVANAYNNQWIGCRHEQGTASTPVAVSGGGSATLTAVAHGLAVDDMVSFIALVAVPTGMFTSSPYYVVSTPTVDTFTVSSKKSGVAVTFATTGDTVKYYRPQKIYLDTAITNSNNVIRKPAFTTSFEFLEIINSTGSGTGNVVETATSQVLDNFSLTGIPFIRGRNRSGASGPVFAVYPSGSNPVEDPYGYTVAISAEGIIFSSAGTEIGRFVTSAGALGYKRVADAAAFAIASCIRSPVLISTISGLSCAALTTTTTTVALVGASVDDHVTITPHANLPAGLGIAYARVSAADTITIGFINVTAAPISLTVDIQAKADRRFY